MATNEMAYAVIGAGYGDEGKGLVTDVLTRKFSKDCAPMVARCNGGAQAAHTVVTTTGQRHVFSHIGSGTLAGGMTYLGENFLVDPIQLLSEYKKLQGINVTPVVFAHPCANVVTIFDVMLNQYAEMARGNNRMGSCGMGINETVTRSKSGYRITVDMVMNDMAMVIDALRKIKRSWCPSRMSTLGIINQELIDTINRVDEVVFAKAMKDALDITIIRGQPYHMESQSTPLIIEGAQGLMLDAKLGTFPHVTNSCTGLPSAIKVAGELNRKVIQPIYVTRVYTTRHGAGELPHEGEKITNRELVDKTNVDNKWQGSLRYAPLNVNNMSKFINEDLIRSYQLAAFFGVEMLPPKLVVTCMDQLGDEVAVYGLNAGITTLEKIPYQIAESTFCTLYGSSWGETAETFKFA